MGMTIEKAKDILTSEDFAGYSVSEILEARDMTLDIMSKYQKIEDIVRDYYNEQYTDKLDIEIIEMISEVLEEDGRWED